MHDFTATGSPDSHIGVYVVIILLLTGALIMAIAFLYLSIIFFSEKDFASLTMIILFGALVLFIPIGMVSTLPMHATQTYKGTFKAYDISYDNQKGRNPDNIITIKNKNDEKQTFQYNGDKPLKKNDKVEIKINGEAHTHPSINKSLKDYRIVSVTKVK